MINSVFFFFGSAAAVRCVHGPIEFRFTGLSACPFFSRRDGNLSASNMLGLLTRWPAGWLDIFLYATKFILFAWRRRRPTQCCVRTYTIAAASTTKFYLWFRLFTSAYLLPTRSTEIRIKLQPELVFLWKQTTANASKHTLMRLTRFQLKFV